MHTYNISKGGRDIGVVTADQVDLRGEFFWFSRKPPTGTDGLVVVQVMSCYDTTVTLIEQPAAPVQILG